MSYDGASSSSSSRRVSSSPAPLATSANAIPIYAGDGQQYQQPPAAAAEQYIYAHPHAHAHEPSHRFDLGHPDPRNPPPADPFQANSAVDPRAGAVGGAPVGQNDRDIGSFFDPNSPNLADEWKDVHRASQLLPPLPPTCSMPSNPTGGLRDAAKELAIHRKNFAVSATGVRALHAWSIGAIDTATMAEHVRVALLSSMHDACARQQDLWVEGSFSPEVARVFASLGGGIADTVSMPRLESAIALSNALQPSRRNGGGGGGGGGQQHRSGGSGAGRYNGNGRGGNGGNTRGGYGGNNGGNGRGRGGYRGGRGGGAQGHAHYNNNNDNRSGAGDAGGEGQ